MQTGRYSVTRAVLGLTIGIGLTAGGLAVAQATDMPPLPDAIKEEGVLRVGVKCDYPPDGFLDPSGKPVGIEVSLAKQIAEYAFGSPDKAELSCVTSSTRIPALVGGKVDMLIATLGISEKRKEVIDFSDPYTWSASSILVPNDSQIQKIKDLNGKTVVFLKGAWQIPWFEKNMPEVEMMKLDTVSDALQAMLQGRADAYAHDWAVHLLIDKKNDRVRMLDEFYQHGSRGIGLRRGEDEWRAYINAALERVRAEGKIPEWIKKYDDPELVDARIELWDPSKAPK